MTTIATTLENARARLAASETPAADAEILLAHALGRDRAWLRAWPESELPVGAAARFEALLARRANGEPVAYLVGYRGFHALEFIVTPDVLIPRPETEVLVEMAINEARTRDSGTRILDLGTGCGCVALSIAHACPDAMVTAVERSPRALAVARLNAERLGLSRVELVEGDWLKRMNTRHFDIIVSNPPYVAAGDPHLDHGDLRFEPAEALVGGEDGLDAIREIADGVVPHLAPEGLVAVEHGIDQAPRVQALFEAEGLTDVATLNDLTGRPRATRARAGKFDIYRAPGPAARAWRSRN